MNKMPVAQKFSLTTVLKCWSGFPQASNRIQRNLLAFNLPSRITIISIIIIINIISPTF